MDETLYWAHLASVEGVGGALLDELAKRFGSLKRALEAPLHEVREIPLMDDATAEAVCRAGQSLSATRTKLEEIGRLGIHALTRLDNDYPSTLRQAQNPPPVVYQAGQWQSDDDQTVALIGSRDCSAVTARRTGEYAAWLVRQGLVVISGYAEGVDLAAHVGALDAGGRTIIIPACGANQFDFTPLRAVGIDSFPDLTKHALWLSEQPPEADWSSRGALARNRMVAAMAKVVLVMEARLHSSTLDTVQKARSLGRPIFCQSFATITQKNMGNDILRREGAKVISEVQDLENLLAMMGSPKRSTSPRDRREDPRR